MVSSAPTLAQFIDDGMNHQVGLSYPYIQIHEWLTDTLGHTYRLEEIPAKAILNT